MSDIPFLNPTVLQQLDLPVPNREQTPQILPQLNLNHEMQPSRDLLAYKNCTDSINCLRSIGKATFKCHCLNCMFRCFNLSVTFHWVLSFTAWLFRA